MFWNRKGKKKEAGDGGADATATTVDDPKTDDLEESTADLAESDTAKAADAEDIDGAKSDDSAEGDGEADGEATAADGDTAAEAEAADVKATKSKSAKGTGAKSKSAKAAKAAKAKSDDAVDEDAEAEDEATPEAESTDADAEPAGPVEPVEPGTTKADAEGVQCVRTAGVLKFEDAEFEVLSNTWIIQADDDGVIVIDPAHDSEAILEAVGEREVYLVACTNGYNTHIQAAVEVAAETDAPIALHRRELRAWRKVHGVEHNPDMEIEGGGSLTIGDLEVDVLATPGTSVGSVGYYISEKGVVFSGDVLLAGKMGTVGGDYIDYTTQLASIGEVLLSLPPETRILPDREVETTVSAEAKNFDKWLSMD